MISLCAVLLFSLVSADPIKKDVVPVEDCGSTAEILSVEFDGCTEPPCNVFHGTTASGRITLRANTPTNTLTCKVFGIVGPIELPFNGCPLDACKSLIAGDCPVEEDEILVYELVLEILDLYPTIEITAKAQLLDDNGDTFMCFLLPISIQP
ncbi:epididymal secretory protein E1 isoform X2 [Eurytemora carolleeae]|uniref:epididymal secretory protein E1 isoform X2 n=1 Tax=Eurytemora carolleeae TaxID=1294199 RepID=UPI000C77391A|nr:epididymal secretory protein E1 isoform X2 [Eurytemora carolleeae]|eukprot:XP_023342723.1 epididymal secretory protein E1-like isoform X2 [Eurytemora affinis]